MTDPRGLGGPEDDDVGFDRSAHPALSGFFDALDDLAEPPADADVRLAHIDSAAATAAGNGPAHRTGAGDGRTWGAVGLRAAAVAAALAVIVAGLGSDDRLPAPAQRVVSSIAERVGVDLPDGAGDAEGTPEDPATDAQPGASTGHRPHRDEGTTERPDREPLEIPRTTSGSAGSPASPAVPASPERRAAPERAGGAPPEPPAPAEPEQRTTPTAPEHRVEPDTRAGAAGTGADTRSEKVRAKP